MTIIQAQPLLKAAGGISGPVIAIDNEVPTFDGITGQKIKAGSGLILSSNLMQASNKALLLDGSIGSTPASGAGTRMMWIPDQAAFRAGFVTDDKWDSANVHTGSIAMGYDPEASSLYSIAIGRGTLSSGQQSVAIGASAEATSISSMGLGLLAKASNNYSLAIGNMVGNGSVEASGTASLAIGAGYGHPYMQQGIKAVGSGSLIIATTSTMRIAQTTGAGAVLIGCCIDGSSDASGDKSLILAAGGNINASANYSMAFGKSCTNVITDSLRIGWNANGGLHIKSQELWFGDTDALFVLNVGTTNGLQIGNAATQKLGFFGATPVTQRLKANYNNWASHSDIVDALTALGLFDQA